jgi:hypothetical protein
MSKLIVGFVLGVLVCTVGLTGIARILDNGVNKIQEVAKESAK